MFSAYKKNLYILNDNKDKMLIKSNKTVHDLKVLMGSRKTHPPPSRLVVTFFSSFKKVLILSGFLRLPPPLSGLTTKKNTFFTSSLSNMDDINIMFV